jgi:hypothetical protein
VRQILNVALRVAPHDGDFHFDSPREAARLLTDLGFQVRRNRGVGLWAFLLDTLKPGVVHREVALGTGGCPTTVCS